MPTPRIVVLEKFAGGAFWQRIMPFQRFAADRLGEGAFTTQFVYSRDGQRVESFFVPYQGSLEIFAERVEPDPWWVELERPC